jgi:hypothetical protein
MEFMGLSMPFFNRRMEPFAGLKMDGYVKSPNALIAMANPSDDGGPVFVYTALELSIIGCSL